MLIGNSSIQYSTGRPFVCTGVFVFDLTTQCIFRFNRQKILRILKMITYRKDYSPHSATEEHKADVNGRSWFEGVVASPGLTLDVLSFEVMFCFREY